MNSAAAEQIDGRRLSFVREGSGQPLVFLHGLGASQSQARATVADIEGVERVTIDAPAHGGSARSPVTLTFGDFSAAILELLDELGIERAIFGGISMGAGIALRIACDAPERVSSLVLVRPAWTDKPGRPHLDIISDIGTWVREVGVDGARHRLQGDERYQLLAANEPLAAGSIARAIGAVAGTGRPDALIEMVDSYPLNHLEELAKVDQPALVIATERDHLHPFAIANEIAAALPNANLVQSPPRYVEPIAHQEFLTEAINSFLSA